MLLFHEQIFEATFKPLVIHQTYVAEINGDPMMKPLVKDSLDYFNSLGNNEVIDYEPKYGKLSRPVKITVRNFSGFWEDDLAGYAYPRFGECIVSINENEPDPVEFRKTVIHEYLHCIGYGHVDDKKDVMYKAVYRVDSTESIKRYAEEIRNYKK